MQGETLNVTYPLNVKDISTTTGFPLKWQSPELATTRKWEEPRLWWFRGGKFWTHNCGIHRVAFFWPPPTLTKSQAHYKLLDLGNLEGGKQDGPPCIQHCQAQLIGQLMDQSYYRDIGLGVTTQFLVYSSKFNSCLTITAFKLQTFSFRNSCYYRGLWSTCQKIRITCDRGKVKQT